MPPTLRRSFYAQAPDVVARNLLGTMLVSRRGGTRTSGRIVETEAYLAEGDSACHAAKHRTARTEVMFGSAGIAYVYPIHAKFCFNIVCETNEIGCAVLIRALEPVDGVEAMKTRRGVDSLRRLTTGPACLCQALEIDRSVNGLDITTPQDVWVEANSKSSVESNRVRVTERIGVTSAEDLLLRFVIRDNPFVSGPARLR